MVLILAVLAVSGPSFPWKVQERKQLDNCGGLENTREREEKRNARTGENGFTPLSTPNCPSSLWAERSPRTMGSE